MWVEEKNAKGNNDCRYANGCSKKLIDDAYEESGRKCEEEASVEIVKETPQVSEVSNNKRDKTSWEDLLESEDRDNEEEAKLKKRQHEDRFSHMNSLDPNKIY